MHKWMVIKLLLFNLIKLLFMTYTDKLDVTLLFKDGNDEQLCISCGKLFQIDISECGCSRETLCNN